ncbi:MAG: hypothetical protein ACREF4_03965 [Gammaproteobacteria bacterium]
MLDPKMLPEEPPNKPFHLTPASPPSVARSVAGERQRSAHQWTACTVRGTVRGTLNPLRNANRGEVPMSGGTAKQKVLEAIEGLPADATLEDAIERLVLLAKIERGLAELDAGQGIGHSEAKRRLLR